MKQSFYVSLLVKPVQYSLFTYFRIVFLLPIKSYISVFTWFMPHNWPEMSVTWTSFQLLVIAEESRSKTGTKALSASGNSKIKMIQMA